MNDLQVYDLPQDIALPLEKESSLFIMRTCQRYLVVTDFSCVSNSYLMFHSRKSFAGEKAYTYLLNVICGLKSKVSAENEIVKQFKDAYSCYLQNPKKSQNICNLIERLFKDNKEIRTKHLQYIGQQSYASLARKILSNSKASGELIILGSGNLANQLAKILIKNWKISISGRNIETVSSIANIYNTSVEKWFSPEKYINYPVIINTVGDRATIFDDQFFKEWEEANSDKLFIDLGSPSIIDANLCHTEHLVTLDDIYSESQKLDQKKKEELAKAKMAIKVLSTKSMALLRQRQDKRNRYINSVV